MNNQTKEQLNKFFNFFVSPQDIGLVVIESEEVIPDEGFWREIDNNILYYEIDGSRLADDFIGKLTQIQKAGKRMILEIKVDPHPRIISLLKEISHFGQFNVKDASGKIIERVNVVPGSIIVVVQRDFINNKITYRNFYNLFNSAFSLNYV